MKKQMSKEMNEKAHEILEELKNDQQHHELMYKKHKKCNVTLNFVQFVTNMISIACHSTAVTTLATTVGLPIGIAFSSVGILSTGIGIFSNELNKRKVKQMKQHAQMLTLARNVDREIIRRCLDDDMITVEDYEKMTQIMEEYYKSKSEISNNNKTQDKTKVSLSPQSLSKS